MQRIKQFLSNYLLIVVVALCVVALRFAGWEKMAAAQITLCIFLLGIYGRRLFKQIRERRKH
jgi:hypothetical protein